MDPASPFTCLVASIFYTKVSYGRMVPHVRVGWEDPLEHSVYVSFCITWANRFLSRAGAVTATTLNSSQGVNTLLISLCVCVVCRCPPCLYVMPCRAQLVYGTTRTEVGDRRRLSASILESTQKANGLNNG